MAEADPDADRERVSAMSDKLDQTPGVTRRDADAEGITRRDDDVEGHSLRREGEGEGATLRKDTEEGFVTRKAFPDDGDDDVEGHSMLRSDEGVTRRDEEGFNREVGPGEGHSSRM
jgi:hypothetical protein